MGGTVRQNEWCIFVGWFTTSPLQLSTTCWNACTVLLVCSNLHNMHQIGDVKGDPFCISSLPEGQLGFVVNKSLYDKFADTANNWLFKVEVRMFSRKKVDDTTAVERWIALPFRWTISFLNQLRFVGSVSKSSTLCPLSLHHTHGSHPQ